MSKEKAVDYFDRHQSSTECHITSDGRVFHTKGAADGFANGLKDNVVKSYTRGAIEAENIPVVDSKEVGGDKSLKADSKVYTIEDLKSFDFEKPDYKAAKNLAKGLDIETKSQKLPDILEALKIAKDNLEPKE